MLALTILACTRAPVRPKWVAVCDLAGPHVTCVNADTVTFTEDEVPKVICHWRCAEVDHTGDLADSGLAEGAVGLDLVFQPDAAGVCYETHAHFFEARCPQD
jgi:hypothetical protein